MKKQLQKLYNQAVNTITYSQCVLKLDGRETIDLTDIMQQRLNDEPTGPKHHATAVLFYGLLRMLAQAEHSVDFSEEDIFQLLTNYELVHIKGRADSDYAEYQLQKKDGHHASARIAVVIDANLFLYQHYYSLLRHTNDDRKTYLEEQCQQLKAGKAQYADVLNYRNDAEAAHAYFKHVEQYAKSSRSRSYLHHLKAHVVELQSEQARLGARAQYKLTLAEAELAETKDTLARTERERDLARKHKKRYLTLATEQTATIAQMQQENHHLQSMVSGRDVAIDKLSEQLSPEQSSDYANTAKYQLRIDELSKNLDDAKRVNKSLTTETQKLKRENSNLKEENQSYQTVLNALKKLLDKLLALLPDYKSKKYRDEYHEAIKLGKPQASKTSISGFVKRTLLGGQDSKKRQVGNAKVSAATQLKQV